MFKLIIEDGEGKTTVIPILKDHITLGREAGNMVRLTQRNISRKHAAISRQNGHVFVEDLDSYNGVRVNGDRIQVRTPVDLKEGDLVEIGDYHLTIQGEGAQAQAMASAGPEEATVRVQMPKPEVLDDVPLEDFSGPLVEAEAVEPAGVPGQDVEVDVTPTPAPRSVRQTMPGMEPTPDPFAGLPDAPTMPQVRAEPTAIVRTMPQPTEGVPRLVVISSSLAGQTFALTREETVLGRTEENDVALDHKSVSRNHAKIVREGDRYSVVDLQSANGVLVNGEPYARTDLRKGDVIELGTVKIRFVGPGEDFTLSPDEIARQKAADVDPAASPAPSAAVVRSAGAGKPSQAGKLLLAAGALLLFSLAGLTYLLMASDAEEAAPARPPQPAPAPPVPPVDHPKGPKPAPGPDNAGADAQKLIKQAQAAQKAGDFQKAKEGYAKAMRLSDPDGSARRGFDLMDRELDAQKQLEEALAQRDANPAQAYVMLSEVTAGTRAEEKALLERRALRPKLVQRHLKEAEKALGDGNLNQAREAISDALGLDDGNKEALKLQERLDKLTNKTRKPPKPPPPLPPHEPRADPPGNKGEGARLFQEGKDAIMAAQFPTAVQRFKAALKADPSLAQAHQLLGVAYVRLGKHCDAKSHYEKFKQMEPNSPTIERINSALAGEEMKNCP